MIKEQLLEAYSVLYQLAHFPVNSVYICTIYNVLHAFFNVAGMSDQSKFVPQQVSRQLLNSLTLLNCSSAMLKECYNI